MQKQWNKIHVRMIILVPLQIFTALFIFPCAKVIEKLNKMKFYAEKYITSHNLECI